jgi:hypothetical protein
VLRVVAFWDELVRNPGEREDVSNIVVRWVDEVEER